jgi:choline dehydrogenase-like flavoprotein
MEGFNLHLPTDQDHFFSEGQISFPVTPQRYLHSYDNFHLDRTKVAQDAVPSNIREDIEYDVIIIGSGMGGGILADALADQGVHTLVLEAGGVVFPTHITNLPGDWPRLPEHHQVGHFVNAPGSKFLFGVHMNLGGRSVYWSGLIPRIRDWELDFWPDPIRDFLKNSGYGPAERLMRKRLTLGKFQGKVVQKLDDAFDGWTVEDAPCSQHQPNLNNQGEIENVLETSTGVFSTADLLLTSMAFKGVAGRDNLKINLGQLALRIETTGSRATTVVCQDLLGNTLRRYKGRIIVLAAGSLESPRIAINSGLHNFNGKIGVGLTDHPAYFSAEYTIPDGNEFAGPDKHAKILMSKEGATFNDHPFNVEVLINPRYWNQRLSDDELKAVPNPPTIKLQFNFASLLDDQNFVQSQGLGQKLLVKVKPNEAGEPHFSVARGVRNKILATLGVPFTADEGMGYGNQGTVHHAGGTLRMSGNGSGVVDTDLKFEQYDNLYVADPSVWPFIPAANPALTLAALSLRLADTLKQRV